MNIILFEDDSTTRLAPIVLGRPAYAIRCGGLRLLDVAKELGSQIFGVVRDHLREIQGDYLDLRSVFDRSSSTLLVNARLVPDVGFLKSLQEIAKANRAGKWCQQGEVIAALVPAGSLNAVPTLKGLGEVFANLLEVDGVSGLRTLSFPHDVIKEHLAIFAANVSDLSARKPFHEVSDGVFTVNGMSLPPNIVCDTGHGPILIEEGVKIGPFAVLQGPLTLGANASISAHALLKGGVDLDRGVKAGGEIGNSIVEAHSNKCHHGYLGHAYVGSWVNLGAGTTNSNLKNTYGSIRAEYGETRLDTGMQFLGCIIGDYTKTAINTSIFTGKVLGVCSNVYGFVTSNVPSFSNYARSFGEVTELPPEVMETTQRRMFERRGVVQRPRDVQLIRAMYEIESKTRELANHPPAL